MASRTIVVDDLTDAEIDTSEVVQFRGVITLSLASLDEDGKLSEADEYSATWDLTPMTANALRVLVDASDLATFITRLRPLVKVNAPDSEVVRKWMKDNHPEIAVNGRGRLPADVLALYRRESQTRTQAGDVTKPTGPDAAKVLTTVANS